MKTLYVVKYERIGGGTSISEADLPTHILASNLSNAAEIAMRFSSSDFQLKYCKVLQENVNLVKEEPNAFN